MFAGLILAGGEGKRWGAPKAFARLPDGRTFLEACFRVLREAGAGPIVATLPPGVGDPGLEGLSAVVLPSKTIAGGGVNWRALASAAKRSR